MLLALNGQILLPDTYLSCITSHFRLRISHLLIFCYRHGELIHSMLFFFKKKGSGMHSDTVLVGGRGSVSYTDVR
jgi:hypothetical protein